MTRKPAALVALLLALTTALAGCKSSDVCDQQPNPDKVSVCKNQTR